MELRDVHRAFEGAVALAGVSLAVQSAEFFSILGPSGCGKSTLLRLIAGLDFPDRGEVWLRGKPAAAVPAHRRPVNTVFQSYALFPHLNVADNIGFGLRMRGVDRVTRARQVAEAMDWVRLAGVGGRWPDELSGGQRQRVALARALVNRPEVLLLDEPLAALDRQLRLELQSELRALQRRTRITFILVTHDQEEALSLSDRVAVMRAGRVVQWGDPVSLYDRPRTRFVAEFLGACNVWTARVKAREGGGWLVELPFGGLVGAPGELTCTRGGEVEVGIRPEHLELRRAARDTASEWNGKVESVRFEGAGLEVSVRLGEGSLRARCGRGGEESAWREGDPVEVILPREHLLFWEVGG